MKLRKRFGLLVDPMSYQYLVGAEIDYTESLQGSQFVIRNPNAETTCGCGSSFPCDRLVCVMPSERSDGILLLEIYYRDELHIIRLLEDESGFPKGTGGTVSGVFVPL
ncbi:iron-sulfur cluster insertion protein ErpA [Neisseria gonorrhoeae]|uniref:Iron-sulfur cluster insertion protein ErpA n=1 Tax=Neisseria gonorrhoeae TaxID=485 RepID=A0A378VVK2_NEIGO|nr:iron-sulfur cluster insertion protein ErpA [Neisseria gonorrhoeae]